MTGEGTVKFKDGSKWSGKFKYNRKHGPGVYIGLDGKQESVRYYWDWTAKKWLCLISLLALLLSYFFR